jgi:hypothetical protein
LCLLDPRADSDIDGDGKLDPFEKQVMQAFKAADRDDSGTLTPIEMIEIMRTMADTSRANKRLGRSVFGLMGLVVLLIGALVGVSISGAMVGGETIKESHVPDCSSPESPLYSAARCAPENVRSRQRERSNPGRSSSRVVLLLIPACVPPPHPTLRDAAGRAHGQRRVLCRIDL